MFILLNDIIIVHICWLLTTCSLLIFKQWLQLIELSAGGRHQVQQIQPRATIHNLVLSSQLLWQSHHVWERLGRTQGQRGRHF